MSAQLFTPMIATELAPLIPECVDPACAEADPNYSRFALPAEFMRAMSRRRALLMTRNSRAQSCRSARIGKRLKIAAVDEVSWVPLPLRCPLHCMLTPTVLLPPQSQLELNADAASSRHSNSSSDSSDSSGDEDEGPHRPRTNVLASGLAHVKSSLAAVHIPTGHLNLRPSRSPEAGHGASVEGKEVDEEGEKH